MDARLVAGRVSLDEAIDAVTGSDAPHAVAGVPGLEPDLVPLGELMVRWRRSGERVQVLLPVPGDVRGVPGPAEFRSAALEAGAAVIAGGFGVVPGVVASAPAGAPTSAPERVTWHSFDVGAAPPDPLDVREAQRDLTVTIQEAAQALRAADVAGSRGDIASLLGGARRAGDRLNLPPGSDPGAIALLAQAERLQAVLDLAAEDPLGGAVDRAGIGARSEALRPLAHAVRRARLAAFNA